MGKIGDRRLAEIKYKLGLCHYTTMKYDKAIADFQQSANYIKKSIDTQKALDKTPEIEQTIDDLERMHDDILNKITDVQDSKKMVSVATNKKILVDFLPIFRETNSFFSHFKQLMSSLMSKGGIYSSLLGSSGGSDGAGSSSSSSNPVEKPKLNDISHLIKRKKPDSSEEGGQSTETSSPAKKAAI